MVISSQDRIADMPSPEYENNNDPQHMTNDNQLAWLLSPVESRRWYDGRDNQ